MAALSDRHTVKKSSFVQRRCIECDILNFGSEREFSAPGKCVSVKRPRAKSTQVDRSVAGLPLPPPTPPMHGFWRFEHVCLHAKQNPTVRVHTGSGERERDWRGRKGDGERRERRECTWYRWWLHPWQKIFLSVRVCMLKLGLIESESNCSLSHSLSLSSYLAFAHAVLALSLERALFLC